jgi:NADP-dependent 3-hydroxy acid dehydrogenase YdfG
VLAARHTDKLAHLATATNVHVKPCDAANANSAASLFHAMDKLIGTPDLLIFNPSTRAGN